MFHLATPETLQLAHWPCRYVRYACGRYVGGQYYVGYLAGKSIRVQRFVGVDKVATRAMEMILKHGMDRGEEWTEGKESE